jgi:hypothetical protein
MSMTMSIVNGELHMPLDMNGMPRCRGSNGVNFGGECSAVESKN